MFWSFIAPKGGLGVSVVAASVAALLSRSRPVTVIDFCGDQPDIFGVGDDLVVGQGVHEWLSADASVSSNALSNLEIEVNESLRILPAGLVRPSHVSAERCAKLVEVVAENRTVIADLGVLGSDPVSLRPLVCAAGDQTTMVVRACYLALRRARSCPVVVDHVVELVEGGRALRTIDIEAVLGQPVTSRLVLDPAIARAVDAGLLAKRLPRPLRRVVGELCSDAEVFEGTR